MPSKRNTVLAILAVILVIWGTSQVDWTRDVPHYPPDFAVVYGVEVGTGLPVAPTPVDQPPERQPKKAPPVEPQPAPGADGETRVTWLQLQPVTGNQTRPVDDPGDLSLAILSVFPDGRLRWGSTTAGSYKIVGDLCKQNADNENFTLIIAPDHKTPWKYVYWAMQVAQENGVHNVGIGVTPGWDEKKNLLAQLVTPLPSEEYVENADCPTIQVLIEEDKTGNVEYTLGAEAGTGLSEMFKAVGSTNTEYAEFIDGNYTRDVNKTPWVLIAPPDTRSGAVCRTLDVIRACAVYTVRFGGEFPARPK